MKKESHCTFCYVGSWVFGTFLPCTLAIWFVWAVGYFMYPWLNPKKEVEITATGYLDEKMVARSGAIVDGEGSISLSPGKMWVYISFLPQTEKEKRAEREQTHMDSVKIEWSEK